uniref:Putative secreted peptide n=1 Tax=Anopheles braziliensis TaxID=58242 RepID=A0A2M3ZU76_9DIPT
MSPLRATTPPAVVVLLLLPPFVVRVGLAGTLPLPPGCCCRLPTRYRYGWSSVVEDEDEAELRSPLQLPESRRRG